MLCRQNRRIDFGEAFCVAALHSLHVHDVEVEPKHFQVEFWRVRWV